RRNQVGEIDELDLADPGNAVDGEQAADIEPRARLLPRLALRALDSGFVQLEIARRQGPEALARVDGPPAQQDTLLPDRDRAHHDLRILIADEAAIGADEPLQRVAFGHRANRRARRLA